MLSPAQQERLNKGSGISDNLVPKRRVIRSLGIIWLLGIYVYILATQWILFDSETQRLAIKLKYEEDFQFIDANNPSLNEVYALNQSKSQSEVLSSTAICPPSKLHLPKKELELKWPVLASASQHVDSGETYLLFRVETRGSFHEDVINATWTCNSQPAKAISPDMVDNFWALRTVLVICPPLKSLSNVTLQTSNKRPWKPGYWWNRISSAMLRMNSIPTRHYTNLGEWWDCQVNHHPVTKVLQRSPDEKSSAAIQPTSILSHIVLATMVKGATAQAYLPQWIEYHRRIFGIGHFFVYVNEPLEEVFEQRSTYHEWEYVTYVPFNPLEGVEAYYFQRTQQNDFLYRVKAFQPRVDTLISTIPLQPIPSTEPTTMGGAIQWIGMWDIDEFLFAPLPVDNGTFAHDSVSRVARLEELLQPYSKQTDSPVNGVLALNTFYSAENISSSLRMEKEDGAAEFILPCNFTFRSVAWPIEKNSWGRQKFFARPERTIYMNVHNVVGHVNGTSMLGPSNVHIFDPDSELRSNHFKIQYNEYQMPNYTETVFRDAYCDWMTKSTSSYR